MDYHQNARLTIHSREQLAKRILEQGLTLKLAAASFNVSAKTAAQVGAALSRTGTGRTYGPKFPAAAFTAPNRFSFIGKGRRAAPAAL